MPLNFSLKQVHHKMGLQPTAMSLHRANNFQSQFALLPFISHNARSSVQSESNKKLVKAGKFLYR